jgi:hypothetical protein
LTAVLAKAAAAPAWCADEATSMADKAAPAAIFARFIVDLFDGRRTFAFIQIKEYRETQSPSRQHFDRQERCGEEASRADLMAAT